MPFLLLVLCRVAPVKPDPLNWRKILHTDSERGRHHNKHIMAWIIASVSQHPVNMTNEPFDAILLTHHRSNRGHESSGRFSCYCQCRKSSTKSTHLECFSLLRCLPEYALASTIGAPWETFLWWGGSEERGKGERESEVKWKSWRQLWLTLGRQSRTGVGK